MDILGGRISITLGLFLKKDHHNYKKEGKQSPLFYSMSVCSLSLGILRGRGGFGRAFEDFQARQVKQCLQTHRLAILKK